jgi:hypothetical protein
MASQVIGSGGSGRGQRDDTNYASSGATSSITTQDWHIHTQSVDVRYNRVNDYDHAVSTPFISPSILGSHIDFEVTVKTNDEVVQNGTFAGDLVQLQTLEAVTNTAASSGFGTQGVINTSGVGIIRRAAEKSATTGEIIDPVGTCSQTALITLDLTPGTFDGTYDTSANVNGIVSQLIHSLPDLCGTFSPTLVDL